MPWEDGFKVKLKDLFWLILGPVGRFFVARREKRSIKDALKLNDRMSYPVLTFRDTLKLRGLIRCHHKSQMSFLAYMFKYNTYCVNLGGLVLMYEIYYCE